MKPSGKCSRATSSVLDLLTHTELLKEDAKPALALKRLPTIADTQWLLPTNLPWLELSLADQSPSLLMPPLGHHTEEELSLVLNAELV